jgi:hypothetical protein
MLSAQIAQGEYIVDPHAIADAILSRVLMMAGGVGRSEGMLVSRELALDISEDHTDRPVHDAPDPR